MQETRQFLIIRFSGTEKRDFVDFKYLVHPFQVASSGFFEDFVHSVEAYVKHP